MDAELKKEVSKIFHIAAFLFVTIFFALPYLVQISTYFHEQGHIKALDKYEIKNYYKADWLNTIPNFFNPKSGALGITKFDLDAYKQLDKYSRIEINTAGIISDLRFLFLIGVYLTMSNIYFFYKIRVKQEIDLVGVMAINWLLFMWLLALIQITIANITFETGDIYQLVRFLRV